VSGGGKHKNIDVGDVTKRRRGEVEKDEVLGLGSYLLTS
jgi:hypothetical protein